MPLGDDSSELCRRAIARNTPLTGECRELTLKCTQRCGRLHGNCPVDRQRRARASLHSALRRPSSSAHSHYAREFQCDAFVGSGYAHLHRDNVAAAADAFRAALGIMPGNGRALVGLTRACPQDEWVPQIGNAIEQATESGRCVEAALLTAGMHAARGNAERACAALEPLVREGEPRQDGWMMSIDPALASLRGHDEFERILAVLAARAS